MFSKYAWVVSVKDKKGTSIVDAFKKIISEKSKADSKGQRKPNKIWVDYENLLKIFWKQIILKCIRHTMKESLLLLRDLLEL